MSDHQKAANLRHNIKHWEDKARDFERQAKTCDSLAHSLKLELDQLLARQPITPVIPLPK